MTRSLVNRIRLKSHAYIVPLIQYRLWFATSPVSTLEQHYRKIFPSIQFDRQPSRPAKAYLNLFERQTNNFKTWQATYKDARRAESKRQVFFGSFHITVQALQAQVAQSHAHYSRPPPTPTSHDNTAHRQQGPRQRVPPSLERTPTTQVSIVR